MHIRTASVDYQLVLAHVGSSDALIVSSQKKVPPSPYAEVHQNLKAVGYLINIQGFFWGGGELSHLRSNMTFNSILTNQRNVLKNQILNTQITHTQYT